MPKSKREKQLSALHRLHISYVNEFNSEKCYSRLCNMRSEIVTLKKQLGNYGFGYPTDLAECARYISEILSEENQP